MIKALLNVIGIVPGETVLDPMMGSGTTLVEACTLGAHAIGLDISPFCAFMARAKIDGLTADVSLIHEVFSNTKLRRKLYVDFQKNLGKQLRDGNANSLRRITALAYLDALGFAARSSRMTHEEAFSEILRKYTEAMRKFQDAAGRLRMQVGEAECRVADARSTDLLSDSVHGIVFSPPYSFAVDYVANDVPQLELIGTDVQELRRSMVGLRGKKGVEQVLNYVDDISSVLRECERVLVPGRFCVAVVGSNSRQLKTLRQKSALHELEPSLEEMFVNRATEAGLDFVAELRRQVTGIANSLREESIIIFQKPDSRKVAVDTVRRSHA